jgi:hypothetical protein
MLIIAHRGYWIDSCEKNTGIAFSRAIRHGFGIETDVRDYMGEMVISHDITKASNNYQTLDNFLYQYDKSSKKSELHPKLAINIKSDGLFDNIQKILVKHSIDNYFIFDMSVPDSLRYLDNGMIVFSRKSELENPNNFKSMYDGLWVDQFYNTWYTENNIMNLINQWKALCFVSPELHGRSYTACWRALKSIEEKTSMELMICTDYPVKARKYFNDK